MAVLRAGTSVNPVDVYNQLFDIQEKELDRLVQRGEIAPGDKQKIKLLSLKIPWNEAVDRYRK